MIKLIPVLYTLLESIYTPFKVYIARYAARSIIA